MPARRRHRAPKPQPTAPAPAQPTSQAPAPAQTPASDPDLSRRIRAALRSTPNAAERADRILGR